MTFNLVSKFNPSGDQPQAIDKLIGGINDGLRSQTLLGITGSGKTFTLANVIQSVQKPTLILSHNKTLSAQLFSEFLEFFPNNHVEYFVSYYDYYQPEAYVPRKDLYIEKEVEINENIERYRSSATQSLLTQKDVIVIATVSCIYGLGNPEDYLSLSRTLNVGEQYERSKLLRHLGDLQYERRNSDFFTGTYRVRGDVVDINIASEQTAIRIEYFGDEIEGIKIINPLTAEVIDKPDRITIFPAKQYVTPYDALKEAIPKIKADLEIEVNNFTKQGKILEAQRLQQRVNYDLEMLQETGYVLGIENYSRYIEKRPPGSPPSTLIDYMPDDWLLIVDESHITMPQLHGMYNGDKARKMNLVDHGFRMRAALDNRPLKFEEFDKKVNQAIFVSATPSEYEKNEAINSAKKIYGQTKKYNGLVEQIIRPTGLLDPDIDIRPSEPKYLENLKQEIEKNNYSRMTYFKDNKTSYECMPQIDDLLNEIQNTIKKEERVLVTTLTKKMAESLSAYLKESGVKTEYIHSEVDTIERVELLKNLRLGMYDVLVGINLLREGLDLPEVSLIAIIDADKEGFLRSETSLMQIIGRAARHENGRVVMYADRVTRSMKAAIDTTFKRRERQIQFNKENNITPKTIQKDIRNILDRNTTADKNEKEIDLLKKSEIYSSMTPKEKKQYINELKIQMDIYADMMEFEKAAEIRDLLVSFDAL